MTFDTVGSCFELVGALSSHGVVQKVLRLEFANIKYFGDCNRLIACDPQLSVCVFVSAVIKIAIFVLPKKNQNSTELSNLRTLDQS